MIKESTAVPEFINNSSSRYSKCINTLKTINTDLGTEEIDNIRANAKSLAASRKPSLTLQNDVKLKSSLMMKQKSLGLDQSYGLENFKSS